MIRGTFENAVDFVPELSRLATFALHLLRKVLLYKRTKLLILHVCHVDYIQFSIILYDPFRTSLQDKLRERFSLSLFSNIKEIVK